MAMFYGVIFCFAWIILINTRLILVLGIARRIRTRLHSIKIPIHGVIISLKFQVMTDSVAAETLEHRFRNSSLSSILVGALLKIKSATIIVAFRRFFFQSTGTDKIVL